MYNGLYGTFTNNMTFARKDKHYEQLRPLKIG